MLLPRTRQNNGSNASWLLALVVCLLGCLTAGAAPDDLADDASLVAAVCPVVYQLDQSPSSRGYHYSFFGNAFFINEQGYLLTVAHVLETFRDGGQPYILVSRHNSPPQLLRADVIAVNAEHDVAILRATPNPFEGKHKVTFLPLAPEPAIRGPSRDRPFASSCKAPKCSYIPGSPRRPLFRRSPLLRIHSARKIRPFG